MLVLMNVQATPEQIANVIKHVRERGFEPIELPGADRLAIGVLGSNPGSIRDAICDLPGVVDAIPVSKPYKQVTREWHPEPTVVDVSGVRFGDGSFVVIAGPCAVESREQVLATARDVAAAGASMFRGGAFKPRSSPYSFRGLGLDGLRHLAEAREATGMPVVTEVLTPADVELVSEYADMLQVGTRNAQNFALLEAVGGASRPVLLKRGLSNTIEEWLLAAEYVVAHGNPNVVLCERGIRTFEAATRNTLDLSAVPVVKSLSHLPVIVDPSHATGHRPLVPPMARAGLAAGADGLMIEVHPDPENALSDGAQSLTPAAFAELMGSIRRLAVALDRQVATAPSPIRAATSG
jgi:3-deoxy-7-phosphoheptulonate synthase